MKFVQRSLRVEVISLLRARKIWSINQLTNEQANDLGNKPKKL
jgi:hypothetical protein